MYLKYTYVTEFFFCYNFSGTDDLWPLLVSGYAWISLLVFISFPWLPESPKYLHQVVKSEDQAYEGGCFWNKMFELVVLLINRQFRLAVLSKLRGLPIATVGWELTNSSVLSRRASQEKWSLIRVLRTHRLQLPLCLVIALQAGQQFSGINAVIFTISLKRNENTIKSGVFSREMGMNIPIFMRPLRCKRICL